jgi:RHS repeat-associated protein
MQPGLAVVLSETSGVNTTRYVHGPRGIHAQKDSANVWEHPLQDGLGSVRSVVDNAATILDSRNYDPYGNSFGVVGTTQTGYGFTGELLDGGGLLDLRARRYNAGLGIFASLDPFEGLEDEPMSLNGYSYVHGNPINLTDPNGQFPTIVVGAVVGAIAGGISSAVMYGVATSGACGDAAKCQMESIGLGGAVLGGAVFGAIAGAIAATGPVGSAVVGGIGFGASYADIYKNGFNVCNVIGAVGSLVGGLFGTGRVRYPWVVGSRPFPGGGNLPLVPVGPAIGRPITIPIPEIITFPIPAPVGIPIIGVGVGTGILFSDGSGFDADGTPRFTPRVENWIENHPGRPDPRLIPELDRGLRPHNPGPEITGSQLKPGHIVALLQNQATHIAITMRANIQSGQFLSLKSQLALPRYRFLRDQRLAQAFDIELEALSHPGIPEATLDELVGILASTLNLYKP